MFQNYLYHFGHFAMFAPRTSCIQCIYCPFYIIILYHLFELAYDIRSIYIPIQNKIYKIYIKNKETETVWVKIIIQIWVLHNLVG